MHDRRTWLETLIIQIRSAVVEPGRLRHPTLPRVGWRHGDRAYRRGLDAVGDVPPRDPVVRGLPEATAARRGVDGVEVLACRRFRNGNLSDPRRRAEGCDVAEGGGVDYGIHRSGLERRAESEQLPRHRRR